MSAPAKPATPLPYEAHVNPDKRTAEILSKAGTVVGTVSADCSEYIVHACNSYPRLVEALQLAVKYYVGTGRTSETVAHVNPDKRTAEILSKAGTVVGTVSADCSEYIVHACNSYPRLVEALQLAVKYYVGTGRTSETVAGESGKAADKIHALLRELGEER